MTPTISGIRLTFMRGSQNLDDTVNFLSIPSTMRPGICAACHMLQMLGKACMHAGHNVHGMSRISRRTAARLLASISGMLRQRGVCWSALLHPNNLTLHTPREETRHIKDKTTTSRTSRLTGAVWSSPCYRCLYIFTSALSFPFHGKHCQLTGLMVGLDGR